MYDTSSQWVAAWPDHGNKGRDFIHRESAPLHYVMGASAAAVTARCRHCTVARFPVRVSLHRLAVTRSYPHTSLRAFAPPSRARAPSLARSLFRLSCFFPPLSFSLALLSLSLSLVLPASKGLRSCRVVSCLPLECPPVWSALSKQCRVRPCQTARLASASPPHLRRRDACSWLPPFVPTHLLVLTTFPLCYAICMRNHLYAQAVTYHEQSHCCRFMIGHSFRRMA